MCLFARLVVAFLVASSLQVAMAADFRIETLVYSADDKESPVGESVTLFTGGTAFDFRDADHRVTIFRAGVGNKPGRFILLDTEREERTEIGADQVAVVMTKLRRWAAMQDEPFLRFTGDPSFDTTFDAATGELRMTSDQLSYRLVTMPVANREAMNQLRTFLDAFAQLHTLLEAGLPPAPRLLVNEELSNRSVVPIEVELFSGEITDKPSLRAEHIVSWILSKQDRQRIESAARQLTEFVEVENATFRHRNERLVKADR